MSVGTVVLVVAALAGLRTVEREWTGHRWMARTGRQGGRWYGLAVREIVVSEVVLIALAIGAVDPALPPWCGLVVLACLPIGASIAVRNRPCFLVPPPHRCTSKGV